jgi:hypothetical protein
MKLELSRKLGWFLFGWDAILLITTVVMSYLGYAGKPVGWCIFAPTVGYTLWLLWFTKDEVAPEVQSEGAPDSPRDQNL